MPDPRITKMAQVLVRYSMALQPGDDFYLRTTALADELNLAVYEEAVRAGAHVFAHNQVAGFEEIFYKHASDAQVEYISPVQRLIIENFHAMLLIEAESNTRDLTNVNPERLARRRKASSGLFARQIERMATRDLKWCFTVYPTHAQAQEADMSLSEYREFVFNACQLNLDDPVQAWQDEAARQARWIEWLKGKDRVRIQGKDVDLTMSIQGRTFLGAAGRDNFPDGEIFTSPVEASLEGWVRFVYPGIFDGQEVIDVELWFEDGKVCREQAAKGQELLTNLLNTDPGARYLGELGIGTNYQIPRFSKNMLFDEKLGGTIHLAVGLGFPEVGGKNVSGLHWDLLCDMAQSEMSADGEVFYRDGKFLI
jgi:aminopeptidase